MAGDSGVMVNSRIEQLSGQGLLRSWFIPAGVVFLALLILGVAIHSTNRFVIGEIRQQIIQRDAEVLNAMVQARLAADGEDELSVVLAASRMKGVFGVRLFGTDGRFTYGFPDTITEEDLAPGEMDSLIRSGPRCRFTPDRDLSELVLVLSVATGPDKPSTRAPVLEVLVPLPAAGSTNRMAAQFLMDGKPVAREFERLDAHLAQQSWLAWGAGGGVMVVALMWAFARLQQTHALLRERSKSLLRANIELARSARMSAVGAVTAHLIHGLRNPLAGLHQFMAQRGDGQASGEDADWSEAASSTRRMQGMISDIVRVLRDEEGATQYELTVDEWSEMFRARMEPIARTAGVTFDWQGRLEGVMSNRDANLVTLVVENVVWNGIQATPKGRSVGVRVREEPGAMVIEVADQGPGLSAEAQERLFQPGPSSKPGGSGIGLVISHQLARHLGARLRLVRTGEAGTVFVLAVPAKRSGDKLHVASCASDSVARESSSGIESA